MHRYMCIPTGPQLHSPSSCLPCAAPRALVPEPSTRSRYLQLLAEAERQRAIIDKLAGLQSQLQAAQAGLAARQESAARHNKCASLSSGT